MLVHLSAHRITVRPKTPKERARFGWMSMWVRTSLTPTTARPSKASFRFAIKRGVQRRWSFIQAAVGTSIGYSLKLSRRKSGKRTRYLSKPTVRDTVYTLIPPARRTWLASCVLPPLQTISETFRSLSYLNIFRQSPPRYRRSRYVRL